MLHHVTMIRRRATFYAVIGAMLGLGSPTGWLAWRAMRSSLPQGSVALELFDHRDLYAYLCIGTVLAFAVAGAIAGSLADRLIRLNVRLRQAAMTDDVTGLRNGRFFHEWLPIECARAERAEHPLSVIMVDIDHFKVINDRWGHAIGDLALCHFAGVLERNVRTGDIACRVGGEEFVVICPGSTLAKAAEIADRMRIAVANSPFSTGAGTEAMTASFGVATYKPGTGAAILFSTADSAMYSAKRSGRNQVSTGTLAAPPAAVVP